jgi:hypothetical protein
MKELCEGASSCIGMTLSCRVFSVVVLAWSWSLHSVFVVLVYLVVLVSLVSW